MISLFEALQTADMRAEMELRYLEPAYRHYSFEFECQSSLARYDGERLNHYNLRATEAREALLLIDTASASVAGAILQTSRQCVSMAWPKERLNKGRLVGSQTLSSVIWYTRNQALHFEDGIPNNPNTLKCIELLEVEMGLQSTGLDHTSRSLARDVIRILGWVDYASYAKDMVRLLEKS